MVLRVSSVRARRVAHADGRRRLQQHRYDVRDARRDWGDPVRPGGGARRLAGRRRHEEHAVERWRRDRRAAPLRHLLQRPRDRDAPRSGTRGAPASATSFFGKETNARTHMTWKRMLAPREVPRALRSRRAGRAGSSHRARRCAGSRTLASGRVLRMRALHGDAVRMRAVSGRASDASPGSTVHAPRRLSSAFSLVRGLFRAVSRKRVSANLRASSLHDAQAHVACPEVGLRVWAECATSREAPGVGLPAGLGPAAPPAALAAKPRSVDRAGGRGRSGGLPGVTRPRGSESAGPARSLGFLTPDATRLGAPPSESPVPPWVSARPGLAVSDSRPGTRRSGAPRGAYSSRRHTPPPGHRSLRPLPGLG